MFYNTNRHPKETDPIDNSILETRGSLYRTVQELGFIDIEKFINFINRGIVLNLGSGGGGLGVDFEVLKRLRGVDLGTIYSINPRHGSHTEEQLKYFYNLDPFKRYFKEDLKDLSEDELEEIHSQANEVNKTHTTNDSWEKLSFPDEFFDKIISTGSYIFYPRTFTESSFLEIYRVLKHGGEMRIGLAGFTPNTKQIDEIIEKIKELNLDIELNLIKEKDIHNLDVLCLQVIKK